MQVRYEIINPEELPHFPIVEPQIPFDINFETLACYRDKDTDTYVVKMKYTGLTFKD